MTCNVFTAECYRGILLTWTVGSREVAQCRRSLGCFGLDSSIFVTLNSAGRSTLTINSVSRTDPFNMEVKWTCRSCFGDLGTVCNKLEVYGESKHCTNFCICLYLCGFFFYLFIPEIFCVAVKRLYTSWVSDILVLHNFFSKAVMLFDQ